MVDLCSNKGISRDEVVSKSFVVVEAADLITGSKDEDRGRRVGCVRRSGNAVMKQLHHLNGKSLQENKPLHFSDGQF